MFILCYPNFLVYSVQFK